MAEEASSRRLGLSVYEPERRKAKPDSVLSQLPEGCRRSWPISGEAASSHAKALTCFAFVVGNANLALIRQALGHRSINSTLAYIGTSDAQAAEALQKALMGLF